MLPALLLTLLAAGRPQGPCDLYHRAHTPCVAAHSTVRALYAAYEGPLYSLKRNSDQATMVINANPSTGFAAAGAQKAFCPNSTKCTVERIFDQSSLGNHLDKVPCQCVCMFYACMHACMHACHIGKVPIDPHNIHKWPVSGIDAMKEELTVGGHGPLYSAYFEGGQGTGVGSIGFRALRTKGVAQGDDPESMYAVVSGTHYNGRCCFDYGNAEGNPGQPHPAPKSSDGKMEAIYFGAAKVGDGTWSTGTGDGPWVMADLEMGVWAGNRRHAVNPRNVPINTTFVTAMLKGRRGGWALKHADAQSGLLMTLFDGPRPEGYNPMSKQGAIVLGIGGDNSDYGVGTFYEGAMTANYTSDATDEAVQANIVAAGYGHGTDLIA